MPVARNWIMGALGLFGRSAVSFVRQTIWLGVGVSIIVIAAAWWLGILEDSVAALRAEVKEWRIKAEGEVYEATQVARRKEIDDERAQTAQQAGAVLALYDQYGQTIESIMEQLEPTFTELSKIEGNSRLGDLRATFQQHVRRLAVMDRHDDRLSVDEARALNRDDQYVDEFFNKLDGLTLVGNSGRYLGTELASIIFPKEYRP